MGARTKLGAALAALVLVACSSEIAPPASPSGKAKPKASKNDASFGLPRAWPKSILMPDLDPAQKSDLDSERGNLRLWGRMRVLVRPDGSMERAPDLLPIGRVSSIRLPARLGGGFVFVSATGRGTELWRAPSWLDPLVPLLSVGPAADMDRPLVAGFDRLYVRLRSGELLAFDPKNGAAVGLGPLPVAPSHGEMVFVDGWRAVVEADLRGPLATFDAGATWRAVPIGSKLRSLTASDRDPDDGVSALLGVDGGYYVLSGKGDLAYFRGPAPGVGGAVPAMSFATPPPGVRRTPQVLPPIEADTPREKPGPLGKRPLRVALERGYPDTDKTAVVAQAGALVRVSLETGAIIEHHEAAYPDPYASCHAIALASGKKAVKGAPDPDIGFVCGIPDGATTVYALERRANDTPRLEPVMRFSKPRAVLESGQGAIVVRGACSDEEPPAGVRPFCVRFTDGSTREVRVRGEVGAERVIALADGRVAILVPPRAGTQGQLSLLEGSRSKHVALRVPDGAPREVETGLWADGMQEVAPGELGGWVEAGGPTFGVRVKLDGDLSVGPVMNEPNGILVSGRFGLALGSDGKVLETTDTGKSWTEVALPTAPEPDGPVASRRCGPAGCALVGWLRVGWGEPLRANDLKEVAAPESPKLNNFKLSGAPLSLSCARGRSESTKKQTPRKIEGEAPNGWLMFQNTQPPPLDKGEVGFDHGDPYAASPVRGYVWGKRDSDWSRTGRFLIRFEDEFALDSVRSTAPSASPWAAEDVARDAFGAGSIGGVMWSAYRDPGGSAALTAVCRGRSCSVFSAEAGQPVLQLTSGDAAGVVRPLTQSAVRVGPTWYFLGDEGAPDRIGLYRADLGRVRQLALLPRPSARGGQAVAPRLVRRAKSEGIGVMFVAREGPFDRRGTRWVMPIDTDTGAVLEPQKLGRPDLGDLKLDAACNGDDGWLVELAQTEISADARSSSGRLMLEGLEARVRIDPGRACIEAGSAIVAGSSEPKAGSGGKHKGDGSGSEGEPSGGLGRPFSIFAMDRSQGGRFELVCRLGKSSGLLP